MSATFEELRREAYLLLDRAEGALKQATSGAVGCTHYQRDALLAARKCIATAQVALNDALHRANRY